MHPDSNEGLTGLIIIRVPGREQIYSKWQIWPQFATIQSPLGCHRPIYEVTSTPTSWEISSRSVVLVEVKSCQCPVPLSRGGMGSIPIVGTFTPEVTRDWEGPGAVRGRARVMARVSTQLHSHSGPHGMMAWTPAQPAV